MTRLLKLAELNNNRHFLKTEIECSASQLFYSTGKNKTQDIIDYDDEHELYFILFFGYFASQTNSISFGVAFDLLS